MKSHMNERIIKVRFHEPINDLQEYYFTSLAAIYERFTVKQIGCTLRTLWGSTLPKATTQCVISRHPVFSKPQSNPKNSP